MGLVLTSAKRTNLFLGEAWAVGGKEGQSIESAGRESFRLARGIRGLSAMATKWHGLRWLLSSSRGVRS